MSSNVYVNGIIAHQDLVDVQALAAGVCKDQGYSGPEQVTDRLVTGQKMGTIESRIWNPDSSLYHCLNRSSISQPSDCVSY